MAGKAERRENKELVVRTDRDKLRLAAAKLYGQGARRGQIAKILVNHLAPNRTTPFQKRMAIARRRLRHWEMDDEFRELVWNNGVQDLDLETPAILRGIAAKAKRGRVDAARLALEVTGRHNPKGDSTPTQVAVVIQGVDRPTVKAVAARDELNGPDD